jgi:hypothetical protein
MDMRLIIRDQISRYLVKFMWLRRRLRWLGAGNFHALPVTNAKLVKDIILYCLLTFKLRTRDDPIYAEGLLKSAARGLNFYSVRVLQEDDVTYHKRQHKSCQA